ncbi:MAG: alpha-L-fucosidase [Treponema sp.]|nr:alpha-L-fucosidase [Treponema sp.]
MKKVRKIAVDQKTWLAGKIASAQSGLCAQRGTGSPYCLFFRGSGSAVWTIDVEKEDIFGMKLGYFSGTASNVSLILGDQIISQTFEPVKGYSQNKIPMRDPWMMQNPEDSESVDIVDTFRIGPGQHELRITVSACTDFRVYYLEMIPQASLASIKKIEARAARLRPDIAPIAKKGYGLFIHWTARTKPLYGPQKAYEQAVNDFNVEMFADQAADMGAKFVIFTAEHVSLWFPAPLKVWEKYHPGCTTKRDLIADLIPALEKRGIKFFMYLHLPQMANYPESYEGGYNYNNDQINNLGQMNELCSRLCEMLEEIGNRYGKKIAGYWLDGWGGIPLKYGIDPTEKVYRATKAGNPGRLTSFAFGVRCPIFTPWEDFACGEYRVIGELPVKGYHSCGQNKGYQYHSIIVLDDDWWHDWYDTPIAEPQYTADQLAPFLRGCMENGGLVSINTAVYQDGTVSPLTKAVMRQTARMVYGK